MIVTLFQSLGIICYLFTYLPPSVTRNPGNPGTLKFYYPTAQIPSLCPVCNLSHLRWWGDKLTRFFPHFYSWNINCRLFLFVLSRLGSQCKDGFYQSQSGTGNTSHLCDFFSSSGGPSMAKLICSIWYPVVDHLFVWWSGLTLFVFSIKLCLNVNNIWAFIIFKKVWGKRFTKFLHTASFLDSSRVNEMKTND